MQTRYMRHWSSYLQREMEFKVYGSTGKPVMFIPCQAGRYFDFENFQMLDQFETWIEQGKCMVFSVDCIDGESWASDTLDDRTRIENHELWYHYIVDEMVPAIHEMSGGRRDILPFGCSMGAMHAANLHFRRPDLFQGVFAISGVYGSTMFFGNYMDDLVYNNSPLHFLENMPQDHPYIDIYNNHRMLFVVGQGAWDEEPLAYTRQLDELLCRKGIFAGFEYWGHDVNHDWPWWFKMVELYMPWFLD